MPGDAAPAPAKEAALNLGALAAGGGGGAGGVGGGGAGGEATAPSGGGGSAAGPSSGQAGGGAPGEGEDVRSGDDAREGALGGEGGGEPRGAPSGGAGAETLEADAAGPSIEAAPVLTRKRAPKEVFIAKDGAAEDGSTDESEKKKRMLKLNRAAQIRYRARRKLKEQELKDGLNELQHAREELVHNKALVLSLTQRNAALGCALTTTLAENATLRTMVANLVPGIFGQQAATANVADPNQWLALGLGWAVPGQPQPQLAQQQQQSPQQQLQLLLGAQAAQPGGLGGLTAAAAQGLSEQAVVAANQRETANIADPNQALALGVAGAAPGQPQPQQAHQAQLAHQQQQSALQQLQLLLGAQAAQPGGLGGLTAAAAQGLSEQAVVAANQRETANIADPNQALALGVAGAAPGQPQPQQAHQAQLAHQQQQSALQQLQLLLGAQAAQPAVLGANQARAPLANPIVQAAPYPLGQPAPARPPAYDAAGSSVPTLGQVLSQLQPTLQPSLALTHYNTASADARQSGRGRRGDGQGEHGQGDHGQGHHGRPSR